MGQRYRRKKDYKPWPGLTLKQVFAKERKKPTVKKCKLPSLGDVLSKPM